MALQHWTTAADAPSRGRLLLIHGLSSIADSWWRMGPALAGDGWDVTAVDQAGHGGRPLDGEADEAALAAAIREVVPEGPDVLVGHSLGVLTALGLLAREPGWARIAILEEPASLIDPGTSLELADGIVADVAAVRADRRPVVARVRREQPRWADEDVHWAVQGIAEMDPAPFARRLRRLARDEPLRIPLPDRVLAATPVPHVRRARRAAVRGRRLGAARGRPRRARPPPARRPRGHHRGRPLPAPRRAGRLARRGALDRRRLSRRPVARCDLGRSARAAIRTPGRRNPAGSPAAGPLPRPWPPRNSSRTSPDRPKTEP